MSTSSSSSDCIKSSGQFGRSSSWETPRVGHFPYQVSLCSARWEKCAAGAHIKPYVSPQCQSISGVPTVTASSIPLQPYKLKPHLPVFLPNLSGIKSFQQLCSWAVTVLMASKRIIIASIQQKLFQRDQHFSCFTDSHICLFPCSLICHWNLCCPHSNRYEMTLVSVSLTTYDQIRSLQIPLDISPLSLE